MKKWFVVVAVLALVTLFVGGALADEEEDGRPGHEIVGVTTHPYTALTMTRISDPVDTSIGFRAGIEAEISDHWYGSIEMNLHDIWTDREEEVIPWDSSMVLAFGVYW